MVFNGNVYTLFSAAVLMNKGYLALEPATHCSAADFHKNGPESNCWAENHRQIAFVCMPGCCSHYETEGGSNAVVFCVL